MASTSVAERGDAVRRGGNDDGSSAVELVVIFPVTLLIVMAVIQVGVWYHGADIARAAAQEGVKAASAYRASAGAGRDRAERVLAENGHSLIQTPAVTPYRDPGVVRITVTGSALRIVPLFRLAIHASATAPVEAFRPSPGP